MTRTRGAWKQLAVQRVIVQCLVPHWVRVFPTLEPPRAVLGALGSSRRIPVWSSR